MKKPLLDYAPLLGLALVLISLDQWTKYMVRTHLPFGGVWAPWPWLLPYARIVHWNNTGAAFGMFQGFGDIFTILAIIVAIAILYYYPQVPRRDWPLRLAMGMQLGGAVGNLIDRLTIGSVTDFISVGRFAVFNVADASISVGVAVLVIGMWIKDQKEQKEQKENPTQTPDVPEAEPPKNDPAPDPLPEEAKGE
ncbi:MAG TPA: signal peptidase II [Anaerolineales bacterium]